MTNSTSKDIFRKRAKTLTLEIGEDERKQASQSICENIAETLKQISLHKDDLCIASFAAMKLEPQLAGLHEILPNATFCYPISGSQRTLSFHQVSDYSQLRPAKYRILSPDPELHTEVSPNDIDVLLCPAWAYSSTFQRLGKGGGYYDKCISNNPSMNCIGVHFERLFFDSIPVESHDQAMQACISEKKIRTR